MGFEETVRNNRSYRRFDGSSRIGAGTLRELVSLARFTPSALNRQPLRYVLSSAPEMNELIFPTLSWAGYLPDWGGPEPAERPAAYIVILLDTTVAQAADIDAGICSQTILLGAVDRGLGGCILANIRREVLSRELGLPDHLKVILVLALGRPVETVVIEELAPGGSVKYWRDGARTHHVPKRPLPELIHASYG